MARSLAAVAAAVLAALSAPSAHAENIADARMRAVASWAAAEPIAVYCAGDTADWQRLTTGARVPFSTRGFTYHGRPEIFLSPGVCLSLVAGIHDADFGPSLTTLLHEAYTHYGSGVFEQHRQECGALVLMYEALRKFYGVPFFTPLMRVVTDAAIEASRRLPASYQGCA